MLLFTVWTPPRLVARRPSAPRQAKTRKSEDEQGKAGRIGDRRHKLDAAHIGVTTRSDQGGNTGSYVDREECIARSVQRAIGRKDDRLDVSCTPHRRIYVAGYACSRIDRDQPD